MAQEKPSDSTSTSDELTQTESDEQLQRPAQKTAGDDDPSIIEENISVARSAPDVVVESLHSTTVPEATDIPTANTPDPKAANPEVNPNAARLGKESEAVLKSDEESTTKAKSAAKKEGSEQSAAKPAKEKKDKAPAVENKPFSEFIQQDYLPSLKQALQKQGIQDIDLAFEKQKIPVSGYREADDCWQVIGYWNEKQHQFRVYFPGEDIQGSRAFSCAAYNKHISTLEPFLIDERKVTLDLLVFGVVQRLNAQKWLGRN
jgi:Protein of unknown function (DUF2996)